MNITWGMVGNSHDASLAVFNTRIAGLTDHYKTELLWASLAKDFSKVPHDPDPNQMQIDVAIQSFGMPNKVVWYERPLLKTWRQWRAGQGWLYKENNIKQYLKRWDITCPIEYTQHHLSHAGSAFYPSPFKKAAILTIDGVGEWATASIGIGEESEIKILKELHFPHSLGLFYSAITYFLGFKV